MGSMHDPVYRGLYEEYLSALEDYENAMDAMEEAESRYFLTKKELSEADSKK